MLKNKLDNVYTGFVLGIILPLIVMFCFYQISYAHLDLIVFIERLIISELFSSVLSICVLVNMILFFGSIRLHYNYAAKGALTATFFYAFVVFGFRLFS